MIARVPTGAILVGGASRRMGQPKHALRLADGRSMLEHVAAALSRVVEHVILLGEVAGAGPWPMLPDRHAAGGPVAALDTLMHSPWPDPFLVCPCDMPLIDRDVLADLARVDAPVVVPLVEGARQHFPIRLDRRAASSIASVVVRDRSMRALLASATTMIAEVNVAGRHLSNVNTPDDVRAVDDLIKARAAFSDAE